jgi:predicted RNA binding protein YcfA (HicA-like mRNA interferase family)
MNPKKLLRKALSSPASLRFEEICSPAKALGFHLSRVNGSHHIFMHPAVRELLNVQV